jgi:purine-binding chemotaxis protein CheW
MDSHRHRHDSKSLVGFVVGDVQYAVPIARVVEIANPLQIVALPHAPKAVCGVADYRGDVVAVVDLRIRFGLDETPRTRRTKWIVVDVGPYTVGSPQGVASVERVVALVVDAVTEVFGTGGADLRPAPALGGGEDVRGIVGVTAHGGGLVFVLDTARLRELTEPLVAAGSIAPRRASLLPKAAP